MSCTGTVFIVRFLFCVFDLHSDFCCVGVRVKIYLIPQCAAAQPYYRFSPFSEKSGFEPSCPPARIHCTHLRNDKGQNFTMKATRKQTINCPQLQLHQTQINTHFCSQTSRRHETKICNPSFDKASAAQVSKKT